MTAFKVFKNETLSKKLTFGFYALAFILTSTVFFTGTTSFAEEKACRPSKEEIKEECGSKTGEDRRECISNLRNDICGSSGNGGLLSTAEQCQADYKDFREKLNEFGSACGQAGMQGGGLSCGQRMVRCQMCSALAKGEKQPDYCVGLGKEEEIRDKQTDTDEGVDSFEKFKVEDIVKMLRGKPTRTSRNGKSEIKRKDPTRQFANCPAYAAGQIEDLEKKAESYREKVYDYENDRLEEEEKLKKAEIDVQAKQAEAREQEQKIQQDFQKAVKELTRTNEEKVERFQEALATLGAQLSELTTKRTEAQNAYSDAISRLDLNCHQASLQRINEERKTRMEKINARSYRTSSLNRLFAATGITSRKKSQKRAKRYFNECRRDRSYKEGKRIAKRSLDQTLQALTAQQQSLMQQQQLLMQRMGKVTPEYQQDLQELQRDAQLRMAEVQRLQQQAIQEALNRQALHRARIQQINARLALEQSDLDHYQNALARANQYSQAGAKDSKDYSDVISKSSNAKTAAEAVISSCNCVDTCAPKISHGLTIGDKPVRNSRSACRAATRAYNDFQTDERKLCWIQDGQKRLGGPTGGGKSQE